MPNVSNRSQQKSQIAHKVRELWYFKLPAQCPHIGMFLLARLVIDNLLNQDCREDLEEELNNKTLPNGIDEA